MLTLAISNSGMSSGLGGHLSRNEARFITNDIVPERPHSATNNKTENLFILCFCFLFFGLCEESVKCSIILRPIYNDVQLLHKKVVTDKKLEVNFTNFYAKKSK